MRKRIVLILILSAIVLCGPVYGKRIGTTTDELEYLRSTTRIAEEATDVVSLPDVDEQYTKSVELLKEAKALKVPTNNNPFWSAHHFTLIGSLTRQVDMYDSSLSLEERIQAGYDAVQFTSIIILLDKNFSELSQ